MTTIPSHPLPDEALIEELEQAWNNLQGERWNTENAVALACAVKPRLPQLLALARSASQLQGERDRFHDDYWSRVRECDALAREASEAKARLERLTSAMAHIRASGHCGADIMEPEKVLAWATELGWTGKVGE
jgi:hypothetical protein